MRFEREADLRDAIERILAPLGRRADEAEPLCDARLPDGSRVNVVLPPLALDGPALTIRRFRRRGFAPEDLVENGTLTRPLLEFLAPRGARARDDPRLRRHRLRQDDDAERAVDFVGEGERVVTIEDAAELRLRQPHVVRLEARPPNLEGRGEVTIRRLVRNALRMRPDRIIVGEVRGAGGARHADRAVHRPRRLAVHRPRRLARRGAAPRRGARADVRRRPPARRDPRAGRRRLRPRRLPGPQRRRRAAASSSVAEVVRVAAGPAARELYAWRDGAPRWRAALGDALAARLEAAA